MRTKALVLLVCATALLSLGTLTTTEGAGGVSITKKFHEGRNPPPIDNVPLFTDVHWRVEIIVRNRTVDTITDVHVRDIFSADFELGAHGPNEGYPDYEGAVALITCGDVNIEPVSDASPEGATKVEWTIGTMAPGTSCRLSLRVSTDINPAGKQEFTSPGRHCLNSGATLWYRDPEGAQHSDSTDPLCVTAVDD